MNSSNDSEPCIILKPGRDGPARKRHHPWIYSQAVAEVHASDAPGDPLPVKSSDGITIGWGLHSAASLIAVRMICFTAAPPEKDWIARRLRQAKAVRDALSIDSDAYRLANAEGDFLPGLVADVYGDTVALSLHTLGMESCLPKIVEGVRALLPDARIFLKRDEHFARVEKLGVPSGYLHGDGDGTSIIREGADRIVVDIAHGQKTGYYLDQRENRGLIARHSSGRRVLNLFSYTGALALRAVSAGATHVISVDSSKPALELAARSAALNPGIPADSLDWVAADVFDFLAQQITCDIVVADPPPFARRRSELEGALKGYTSLFQQCLRVVASGGIAFLFSCSGAVDRTLFQQVVTEACLRSGRQARILRELHADVDHPVAASHPEGEYLKGLMVHVQ